MKVQHLVLTRYTLKRPPWSYDEFTPEWLEERIRLFQTYCVPGMRQQSSDDFSWLVLCDESTDPDHIERILDSTEQVPRLSVALTSLERDIGIPEVITPLVDESSELLITTRLDSDDCFHSDAIATINSYAETVLRSDHESWLLNLPRGYRYDEPSGRLYTTYWLHGPYVSLFERLGRGESRRAPRGVYHANHFRLHHQFPAHLDDSIPAWLQVVHGLAERFGTPSSGGNKSTTVLRTDIEVDPAEIEESFAVDLVSLGDQLEADDGGDGRDPVGIGVGVQDRGPRVAG